jgi:hypothetical protein
MMEKIEDFLVKTVIKRNYGCVLTGLYAGASVRKGAREFPAITGPVARMTYAFPFSIK